MKWWRRFVQHLARRELAELTDTCMKALTEHTRSAQEVEARMKLQSEQTAHLIAQIEHGKRLAFAEGQALGRHEMHEYIEWVVNARTCGVGGDLTPEDLDRAKKGLLH